MTIRDNVEAVHRLLAEDLKVTHLRAVIGFSMGARAGVPVGGQLSGFADRIVATSGTAKTWPHGVVRLEGQIAALTADPAFNGGDYTSPPRKGIEAYGMVWLGWLYSQEWWRREMWKTTAPDRTLEQEIENRRRTFFANNDANDLILQARTWQRHDVGTTPGFNGDVEQRAPLDHRAGALHAVGNRPLFPDRRRAVRGAVHPPRVPRADSVAVGPPGRRGRQSGRSGVSQRKDRPVSGRRRL